MIYAISKKINAEIIEESEISEEIVEEINAFRENPRSVQHQIEVLRKGISRLRPKDPFLNEIDEFVKTIDRIPKLKPVSINANLCKVARDEVRKFTRNPNSKM